MTQVKALKSVPFAAIVMVGVCLGLAVTISPMSVLLCGVLVALLVVAGRGLPVGERRWIWALFAVAVVVRLAAIVGLLLWHRGELFVTFPWDLDGIYLKTRSVWMRDLWLGLPVPPEYATDNYGGVLGWTSYLYVLAALQVPFGPAPYAIHLLSVVFFIASAVLLHRLVRLSYGEAPAMVGLAILLFYPTIFLWSISALKEPFYLFLGVIAVTGATTMLMPQSMAYRLGGLAVLLLAALALSVMRRGGDVIVLSGVGVGALALLCVRRSRLLIPVAGVMLAAAVAIATSPVLQVRLMTGLFQVATLHVGHVMTPGFSYKLLDPRFYEAVIGTNIVPTLTMRETAQFLLDAMVSVVLVPLPWQVPSVMHAALYVPLQAVWYALVVLGCIGAIDGLRRDPVLTCVLAGVVITTLGVLALVSGNVGTLVRHRDGTIPFLVWMSALGALHVLSRIAVRGTSPLRSVSMEPSDAVI